MFRIDNPTASEALPVVPAAGEPGYFKGGNPATADPATVVEAWWLNMIQEELLGVIEYFGIEPDKADFTQLRLAIQAAIAAAPGFLKYNVAAILEKGYFTKPVPVALAAGHAVIDPTAGNVFVVDVDASFTFDFPAGMAGKAGMMVVFAVQDEVGGHELTTAAGYHATGGEWATAAGAVNILWLTTDGSGTDIDVVISQRGA